MDDNAKHHESRFLFYHSEHRHKKPSKITVCYFMGAAYFTSLGSCGSILGSGTNLALQFFYETRFHGQKIDFLKWMYFNIPLMLINAIFTWIYLQWYFMGMFRPHSKEAKEYNLGCEGEKIVRQVIIDRYNELGPISQQEIQVAAIIIISILLCFLREPGERKIKKKKKTLKEKPCYSNPSILNFF